MAIKSGTQSVEEVRSRIQPKSKGETIQGIKKNIEEISVARWLSSLCCRISSNR